MVDCVVSLSSRRLEEERTNCAAASLNKPYILQFHISVISHLIMEEWIQSRPATHVKTSTCMYAFCPSQPPGAYEHFLYVQFHVRCFTES